MPDTAEMIEATKDHLISTWHNVLILVWKQETTTNGVNKLKATYASLSERFPKNVFLLTIVEQDAPMPASTVRVALADFLASCGGKMVLSGVVHEGSGFRAAAVRSVVTGLAMMANLPYPHKVFANVDDAARWLHMSSPVGKDWNDLALIAAVREARSRGMK